MASSERELWPWWMRCVGHDRARFEGVIGRHREPHRRYHDVSHVGWVIRHAAELIHAGTLDDVSDRSAAQAAVVAAAFYHDAVYDPRSPTNEEASAQLARRELTAMSWPSAGASAVAAMIEGTSTHRNPPDAATAVLFDADLAVLGADPAGYRRYVDGVRFEYGHLDESAWRAGRRAVVHDLLGRTDLFATSIGRRRWSARATANLEAELAMIG